jgi:hypothetical protein
MEQARLDKNDAVGVAQRRLLREDTESVEKIREREKRESVFLRRP